MEDNNTSLSVHDIHRYDENLQQIMTTPPRWITRWGITLIFCGLLVVLLISCLVKYPNIVKSDFILTSYSPSIKIAAKQGGRLILLSKNKEFVHKGSIIGYIENSASFKDIIYLFDSEVSIKNKVFQGDFEKIQLPGDLQLGEIQSSYTLLQGLLKEINTYSHENKLNKYIRSIHRQQDLYQRIDTQINDQQKVYNKIDLLSHSKFQRDSFLFDQKIISKEELENSENNRLLPAQLEVQSNRQNSNQNQLRLVELETRRNELIFQENQYLRDLVNKIILATIDLEEKLLSWKDRYALVSPIEGTISLFDVWSNNHEVDPGNELMTITPIQISPVGIATLPAESSGKVKEGQRVLINFDNFQFNEYGYVPGVIKSISLVPKEKKYNVFIELPQGLTTDVGKRIDYKEQMAGTANIITEDHLLIQRVFFNLTKIVRQKS
jgi:hypothetical protein